MRVDNLYRLEAVENNAVPFFHDNDETMDRYLGFVPSGVLKACKQWRRQSKQGRAVKSVLARHPAPSLGREGASGNSPKGES